MDRRDALKKMAVGGVAVGAASVVTSTPAFAFTAPVPPAVPTVGTTPQETVIFSTYASVPVTPRAPPTATSGTAAINVAGRYAVNVSNGFFTPQGEMSGAGTLTLRLTQLDVLAAASATITYMIRYRCTYGQTQADTCASWDVTFTAAPSPVFWSTAPTIGPRGTTCPERRREALVTGVTSPPMRVLVTGAAGFIGSHVAERFARCRPRGGRHRRPVDRIRIESRRDRDCGSSRVRSSTRLRSPTPPRASTPIVHLAARPSVPRSIIDPVASHEANATGTLRVLEAARALDDPIVIVASSSSVYGANPTLPKHEDLVPQPLSPYAASKLATEQYTLAWQHSYGLRTLAFRFFNVFGPRQAPGHAYAAVIPAFTHAALTGEPITVHGDGTQSRDFTYVGTVTDVIRDAVTRGVTCPTPVNLAFGTRTTLLEVIDRISDLVGHRVERRHVETRPGDVPHSQADTELLRSLFPDVDPVTLDDGLRATVEWMQKYVASPACPVA